MSVYRFALAALLKHQAHGGTGHVHAARVRERLDGSSINFVDLVEVAPGMAIGLHRHGLSDEEIYVIVTGNARMTVDGTAIDVGAGDVVVNRPGGAHSLLNTGDHPVRLVVIDVARSAAEYEIPEDIDGSAAPAAS